jgi:pimeloyl-ACP methyl ester carboxylesterase
MASRARIIASYDRLGDAGIITCPTLVLHGEPALDHVVDVGTTCNYLQCIHGARDATLTHTGHLGFATRPLEFARLIHEFLSEITEGRHGSAA